MIEKTNFVYNNDKIRIKENLIFLKFRLKRRRRWRFVFTLAHIAMRPSNVCGKSRKDSTPFIPQIGENLINKTLTILLRKSSDLTPFILQIGENSINQTFKILIRSTCKKKSSDSISYILQTSTSLDSTPFILQTCKTELRFNYVGY